MWLGLPFVLQSSFRLKCRRRRLRVRTRLLRFLQPIATAVESRGARFAPANSSLDSTIHKLALFLKGIRRGGTYLVFYISRVIDFRCKGWCVGTTSFPRRRGSPCHFLE